jgi:hypothetical protein
LEKIDSPVHRAIGAAGMVVVVAVAAYSVAATLDRWPDLVIGAWGAALGAGLAINRIALRETDWPSEEPADRPATKWTAGLQHQICVLFVAIAAWQTAVVEHFAWAAATVACAWAWAWTLSRVAAQLEHATRMDALRAYFRSFLTVAVLLAVSVIYASVAIEAPRLWRPATPADLQWLVWFAILQFASLPATFLVLRS